MSNFLVGSSNNGGGSPTGSAGGDLSGNYPNPIVGKLKGATIPSGTGLTIGNILQVSGSSSLSYGPLNLAGGSDYITGILPVSNLPDASTSTKGIVQLAGDLQGTSISPEVKDLTIAGEIQGSILYFDGSNWSQLSPGLAGQSLLSGGPAANPSWVTVTKTGIATLDFGNAPGKNDASLVISSQTGITTNSNIRVWIQDDSTATHNSIEHRLLSLQCAMVAGDIINNTSFTIFLYTTLRLTGTFNVRWQWR